MRIILKIVAPELCEALKSLAQALSGGHPVNDPKEISAFVAALQERQACAIVREPYSSNYRVVKVSDDGSSLPNIERRRK